MMVSISALVAVAVGLGQAQAVDDPADGLAALIEQTGSPGGALVRDCGVGQTLNVAGDRIARSGVAIEADDLWHLGSNTKAMTATLAARLVDRGVIGWQTPLGEVMADSSLDIHPELAAATLEEFLSHRSGIVSNAGMVTAIRLAGADADRDLAEDRQIYAQAVLREPGGPRGEFVYSNAGYVIAGMMLERAADEVYERLMATEVFEPLGMTSAGWGPPGQAGEADQPRGHRAALFGGLSAREPGAAADNPPAMNAAGRAHMTLEDLARFMRAHAVGDEGYLSEAGWAALHQAPAGGNYALGWGVRDGGVLAHAGSNTMWFMQMAVNVQTGCVAAVAVNDGRIDHVAGPVSRLTGELLDG